MVTLGRLAGDDEVYCSWKSRAILHCASICAMTDADDVPLGARPIMSQGGVCTSKPRYRRALTRSCTHSSPEVQEVCAAQASAVSFPMNQEYALPPAAPLT